MRGVEGGRRIALIIAPVIAISLLAPRGDAFEAFDGRLQAHGFFESQMRFLNRNLSEQWDMAQWYNILNIEFELDIVADEPFGPLDLLSAFVRVEGRYDCVYSHGCGMFESVNAYGNDSKSLPDRLNNAHEYETAGQIYIDDLGRISGGSRDPIGMSQLPGLKDLAETRPQPPVRDEELIFNPNAVYASVVPRRFRDVGRPKAYFYTMDDFNDFRITNIGQRGGANGGFPTFILGPWLPKNTIHTLNGAMVNRVNPFDSSRLNAPTVHWGLGALPMRSIPIYNEDPSRFDNLTHTDNWTDPLDPANNHQIGDLEILNAASPYRVRENRAEARGLYYPSAAAASYLATHELDDFDYNLTQNERAWNRGASQQDEKELKEAYLDIEMFDSRLWLRVGKQTIVWGKTELFPTVDQWNPQDLALGSLVSLEESRIGLWAFRGVYSFYEVGPLEDFRLEFAFNFDEFEPADLGACGEAYTPNIACGIPMGSFAHSWAGIGILAIDKPEDPWSSFKGWEVGARIEFRWDRYSFSISDFWGYNDFPHIQRINTYERNVDPNTGRMRQAGYYGPCTTQDWLHEREVINGVMVTTGAERYMDPSCLRPGPRNLEPLNLVKYSPDNAGLPLLPETRYRALRYLQEVDPSTGEWAWVRDANGDLVPNTLTRDANGAVTGGYIEGNALENHPGNQTLFALGCSFTLGTGYSDISACGVNTLNSRALAAPGTSSKLAIVTGVAKAFAGSPFVNSLLPDNTLIPFVLPIVQLDRNLPSDAESLGCVSSDVELRAGIPKLYGCGGESLGRNDVGAMELGGALSPEQEALLGCGPFFGTSCDREGIDLLNTEASALVQSFMGIDNGQTRDAPGSFSRTDNRYLEAWDFYNPFADQGKFDAAPDDQKFRYALQRRFQPGTVDYMLATDRNGRPIAGVLCSVANLEGAPKYNAATGAGVLPGCRWSTVLKDGEYVQNEFYDPLVDGITDSIGVFTQGAKFRFPGYEDPEERNCLGKKFGDDFPDYDDLCSQVFARPTNSGNGLGHPFTGEEYATELAALSWNFQMLALSQDDTYQGDLYSIDLWASDDAETRFPYPPGASAGQIAAVNSMRRQYVLAWKFTYSYTGSQEAQQWLDLERIPRYEKVGQTTIDGELVGEYVRLEGEFLEDDHCSFVTPQFCPIVQDLLDATGQTRNTLRAGGNGTFGRRTFIWQSGGEIALAYEKRNVLGFAMDFAEDRTKSNWGIEATWIDGVHMINNNSPSGTSMTDEFNVTIAVDRPTFINFLNPNRTFFVTSQWFITYRPGYEEGYTSNGPWNVLGMIFFQTGYFQDRLVANQVFVYDFMSNSGGALSSVMYRISENFSLTVGVAFFMGKTQLRDMPVNPIAPSSNRSGRYAYQDSVENGLAAIRDRDEVYVRLRYTF